MRRPQFSLKTLLWLTALAAAFLGGRAIGIQDERKRLPAELVAEKEQLLRLQNETGYLNSELDKRIAEWIKEANDLNALRNDPRPARLRFQHGQTK